MTTSRDAVCRGCIAAGNYCGNCSKCRKQIEGMYEGLLTIAARSSDSSSADTMCYVADALGLTVDALEMVLEAEEAGEDDN